jgi:hypothetical protein
MPALRTRHGDDQRRDLCGLLGQQGRPSDGLPEARAVGADVGVRLVTWLFLDWWSPW